MGIHDRDYARSGGGGGMGPRSGMMGAWRGYSANTWLIIINVAVFVLGATVLGNVLVSVPTQRYAMIQGVTEQQRDAAVVDRSAVTIPQSGEQGYRLIDPSTNRVIGYQVVLQEPILKGLGHFSTGKGFIELEVWRLVTFQFLHAGMTHLLMNMIGLYFFGPVVERRLGSKRVYLAFYLVCGIFGALLYLVLNLLGTVIGPSVRLPGLLFQDVYTPLVGASAGVFGVLIATAYLSKDAVIYLMFVLPMKIRYASVLLIGIEMWHLLSNASNAGGNAAHLGGAAAGWWFIRRTHLLTDFFEILGPGKKKKGGGARGTFPRDPKRPKKKISARVGRSPSQQEVDRVLDKVREEGMHSLSDKEKAILKKATDEKQGR